MAELALGIGINSRRYLDIAWLWIRAAWAYPASFIMLAVGNAMITSLDFVGLWIMFSHLDNLAGFTLPEVGLLYGAGSLGLGIADTLIGSVERIGVYVRTGRLDQMLTKPVPLLVQVCADQFTLRRLGRITQAVVVFGWAATYVDWTPLRLLVALSMVASGRPSSSVCSSASPASSSGPPTPRSSPTRSPTAAPP